MIICFTFLFFLCEFSAEIGIGIDIGIGIEIENEIDIVFASFFQSSDSSIQARHKIKQFSSSDSSHLHVKIHTQSSISSKPFKMNS
jgi:pyruvate kinase